MSGRTPIVSRRNSIRSGNQREGLPIIHRRNPVRRSNQMIPRGTGRPKPRAARKRPTSKAANVDSGMTTLPENRRQREMYKKTEIGNRTATSTSITDLTEMSEIPFRRNTPAAPQFDEITRPRSNPSSNLSGKVPPRLATDCIASKYSDHQLDAHKTIVIS